MARKGGRRVTPTVIDQYGEQRYTAAEQNRRAQSLMNTGFLARAEIEEVDGVLHLVLQTPTATRLTSAPKTASTPELYVLPLIGRHHFTPEANRQSSLI